LPATYDLNRTLKVNKIFVTEIEKLAFSLCFKMFIEQIS